MTETRNEYFDSESLSRMGTALDEAWRTLPASSLSDLVGREQFVEDGRRLGRVESGN